MPRSDKAEKIIEMRSNSLRNPRADVDVAPVTAEDTEIWTITVEQVSETDDKR